MKLILAWVLHTAALILVTYIVPGISVSNFTAALIAAAVIGLINTFIKPILVVLTLPVTVVTLGLFLLVINGLLFYLAGYLLSGFNVSSIWVGIIGALVYSVISWLLTKLLVGKD